MQKRAVYFNGENMGSFNILVDETGVHITDDRNVEKKYMEIKIKGTNTSLFVDQMDETIFLSNRKIDKSIIGEYVQFDLTEQGVATKMSIIMENGG